MNAMQKAFDEQIARNKSSIDLLTRELKAKEDALDAEQKEADNDLKIATMVLSAVGKIPVPKDGEVGPQGEQGERGDPGVPGTKGIKGDTGPQGKQGLIGLTGKQGPKGDQGKQGEKGTDGTLGAKGEQGPKGDTGEAGKDGLNGRDGTNGEDGIDGKAGPKGDRGEAGRDGKDGLDGKHGVAGKEGTQGKKGPKGDQGLRGLPGKQGVTGKEGSKGKSGEDGVGIKDINAYGQNLHIELTNGKVKQVYMPVRGGGSNAPVPPMDVQRASRTPLHAEGIVADNVQDGMLELKSKIVQSSAGNPFDPGTSESFMFSFNPYDETHDGKFVYNDTTNQLISKTIETAANVILYTVDFSYNGKQLESKLISDEINNDSVRVDFTYDIKGRLIDKAHTYVV